LPFLFANFTIEFFFIQGKLTIMIRKFSLLFKIKNLL